MTRFFVGIFMYSHVVYAFGYRCFPLIFAFVRPLIDQAKMLHFSGFDRHKSFGAS